MGYVPPQSMGGSGLFSGDTIEFVLTPAGWYHLWDRCIQRKCKWLPPLK